MRTFFKVIGLLSILGFLTLLLGNVEFALSSGNLTTSQDSQAGQVRLRTDGDIIYLTSETVPGEAPAVQTTSVDAATNDSEVDDPEGRIFLKPPRYADNIGQVFRAVLNLILVIAILLVFAYIVLGAFQWLTSGGDRGKTDQARQKVISAVVGLLIIVSSYAIINIIARFLGFASVDDVVNLIRPISTYNTATDSAVATPSATPAE